MNAGFAFRFPSMQTLLGMFAILWLAGCASHREPIYQPPPMPIMSDLTVQQIEKAIMEGCLRDDWIPSKAQDGMIEATLHRREHVAVVQIYYTRESFTVKYERSDNLNYTKRYNGTEEIHEKYNQWTQKLIRYINSSISRVDRSRS